MVRFQLIWRIKESHHGSNCKSKPTPLHRHQKLHHLEINTDTTVEEFLLLNKGLTAPFVTDSCRASSVICAWPPLPCNAQPIPYKQPAESPEAG